MSQFQIRLLRKQFLFRSGKNRKILYKIKDSKRTMKNTKKKDNKPLKKIDLAAKKPPPL